MDFIIYLLLTAVLLIRPEELFTDLAGTRLYLWVILPALVITLPRILQQLRQAELDRQPLTACVVVIWLVVIISSLARGLVGKAWDDGIDFGKVILFYLLTVAVLNTPERYQFMIRAFVVYTAVVVTLGILNYFDVVKFPGIVTIEHPYEDVETGEITIYRRMVSSGIFNDPNDLCLIINAAIVAALYLTLNPGEGLLRIAWGGFIVVFFFALVITYSRGGMLGLVVGVTAYLITRFGQTRATLIAGALIPMGLAVIGGRQANIGFSGGNDRMQLWAQGLSLIPRYPIFGYGMNMYADEVGLTAHNSFINSYMELGFVGGSVFAFAVFLSVYVPWIERIGNEADITTDFELNRFRPYLIGMVVTYAAGMLSLSRAYVVPTYLMFGLSAAFVNLTSTPRLESWYRIDRAMFSRLILVGIGGYIFFKLITQTFTRW